MEKQQIGLITSVVANVVLAILLIFFIFKLNASSGTVDTTSSASKILMAADLGCVQVNSGDALLIIDVQNDFMPARPYTAQSPRHAPEASVMTGTNLNAGSLPVPQAESIVSHINPLIDTFEAAKGTVIFSLDWHPSGHCSHGTGTKAVPVKEATATTCKDNRSTRLLNEGSLLLWPVHCVEGTWGAQFDPHLKVATTAPSFVVKKGSWPEFDAFSTFDGRMSKYSSASDATIVDADAGWEDMKQATKRLTDVLKERKIQRLFIVGIATDYCVASSIEDALIALNEIPGLTIATIKEAVAGVFPENSQGLFDKWSSRGVAVLSEKNKDGKPLLSNKC